MRALSLASLCIAALLTAAAAPPASAQTIKIGVFGPLTGDAAAMGSSEKEAVELAVKEKNDAGGIRGKKVEVVYGDDAGKPEEAVNVAKR
ncbi:MAG: ABC transporter substrate-binding protein, partial [Xanthobacteraceae bacterium]